MNGYTRKLHKYYHDSWWRGWTSDKYSKWRGGVIRRINILYKTKYKNLSDESIIEHIDTAQFMDDQRFRAWRNIE